MLLAGREDSGPREIDFSDGEQESEDVDGWCPAPLEEEVTGAPRAARSKCARDYDILKTLVAIYGSKEVFLTEYEDMLAGRLLGTTGHHPGGPSAPSGTTTSVPCDML